VEGPLIILLVLVALEELVTVVVTEATEHVGLHNTQEEALEAILELAEMA
jgi:hypothetical protein